MQFAVFTVSLPEWTPAYAVERLAALGYDGVEWRVIDEPPHDGPPGFWRGNRCSWPLASLVDDAPRIRALTDEHGLAMPNLGTYVPCFDLDAVERAFAGAAALGVPSARVLTPNYDGREPYLPLRDRSRAAFDDVAVLAARYGVRALVEIHMGTLLPSASAAAQFCAPFDPAHVAVLHDAGNMVFEGYEQYRLGLELLGPYLAHVHVKSARWTPTGTRGDGSIRWAPSFAPLRAGSVDLVALSKALATVDYDGWVSFEDFSTERPLDERVADNLVYVQEIFGALDRTR